jgi:hypothetical protein
MTVARKQVAAGLTRELDRVAARLLGADVANSPPLVSSRPATMVLPCAYGLATEFSHEKRPRAAAPTSQSCRALHHMAEAALRAGLLPFMKIAPLNPRPLSGLKKAVFAGRSVLPRSWSEEATSD